MNRTYFRQADAAIFVYDVGRKETIDDVMYWQNELDEVVGTTKRVDQLVTALVANKIDLPEQEHAVAGDVGL